MNATLADKEFEQFQSIYQQVGIKLDTQKKTMLVSRLGKRLRHLKLASFQAYFDCVNGKEGEEELTQLLDLVSTNKTDFFREPVHFDFLREQVIPKVEATRTLRIWSSASSSGEEAYTIAMTLCDAIPGRSGWNIKILASDISPACWPKRLQAFMKKNEWPPYPKILFVGTFCEVRASRPTRSRFVPIFVRW